MTHAALIALAVVATAPTHGYDRLAASGGVEHVTFTAIPHLDPLRVADAARDRNTRPRKVARTHVRTDAAPTAAAIDLTALDLSTVSLGAVLDALQISAGDVDLAAMASDGIEFARNALSEFTGAVRFVPAPNAGYAYTEDAVEKVVAPYGTNPRPRYPEVLQMASVEESFVVKFVVDSSGRVDKGTLEFPRATHRLFIKSVRDALLRSRFLPAELGGRRVAQLVQQRFSFILERRLGSDR